MPMTAAVQSAPSPLTATRRDEGFFFFIDLKVTTNRPFCMAVKYPGGGGARGQSPLCVSLPLFDRGFSTRLLTVSNRVSPL